MPSFFISTGVLTLQQNVLSKNEVEETCTPRRVLTLQQNVLSKNKYSALSDSGVVLTLQQNVLSKNEARTEAPR